MNVAKHASGSGQTAGHDSQAGYPLITDDSPDRSLSPATPNLIVPRSVLDQVHRRPSRWQLLLKSAAPRWRESGARAALHAAPPWLFSLLLHMIGLLILAVWLLPNVAEQAVTVTAVFSESVGEQLDQQPVDIGAELQEDEQVITPPDDPPVDQPEVVPPEQPAVALQGTHQTVPETLPEVGLALEGRQPGRKQSLLAAYGGTEQTERAVREGLEWLRRNQRSDGTWALNGPYSDGATTDNPTAATAMAMIAFQGAGHTHQAGAYQPTMRRAVRALLGMQNADGNFYRGNIDHHRLYSQAQAMIAACELYGMTQDPALRSAAERSVEYAVRTQDRKLGGWRYQPGFDSDTSVTGWFMMGLQSARMAGLEVPTETLDRISEFLDRVAEARGARYGYQPGMEATETMTAEALLCRQYLGWSQDDRRLKIGTNLILSRPIDWEDRDVYYWYYATQVLHHLGEDAWHEWNRVMREVLPAQQTQSGPERGSWFPIGDRWGPHGGRLYVTCMSLFMLEVYYRHLPLYTH